MRICFILEGYPTKEDPFMPFVRELIAQMAIKGIDCTVIAPQSITRAIKNRLPIRPKVWIDKIADGVKVEIHQPYFMTFSGNNPVKEMNRRVKAAAGVYKKLTKNFDALYAHFWHMGVAASKIDDTKPIFLACGESQIEVYEDFIESDIDRFKDNVSGIVYVGTKSYNDSRKLRLQKSQEYIIAPNGYNSQSYKVLEKESCRKELGWSKNDFIVTFVGAFSDRKGVLRLAEAINMSDKQIKTCFIGKGSLDPNCKGIIYKGTLPHDEVPLYLSASDVFVLPTNNEGCCNAIVEALACGLPVISSNKEFNADILDDSCALKINEENIDEIKDAIEKLYDDRKLLAALAEGAKEKAKDLTLEKRAQKIIDFIKETLERKG